MRNSTRNTILLILCTFLCICCLAIIFLLGKSTEQIVFLGSYPLSLTSIKGIVSAVNMLLCILLVFIRYNLGSCIAFCIIGCSIVHNITQIITTHSLYSLPGILTSFVSLFSIIVIYFFYKHSTLSSYTDFITGLKNRRRLSKDLDDKIEAEKKFCIACLEIENFKRINDVYGIQVGDYVLQQTATRIIRFTGRKDCIYKITGAIFTIFFESEAIAQNMLTELTRPEKISLPIKKGALTDTVPSALITLAAGVAQFPSDADNATALLTHADTALNAAKKSESKKVWLFTADLEAAENKQREAEALVREALEKDWFYLVYQPQFTLKERKLRGFETLIRCKRSDGAIVSPAAFIPAAEKTNLILQIDDYVLRRAMKEFKPVLTQKGENYIISINVSAKNIGAPDFATRINRLLTETDFPPQCLEIEITEYSLADSLDVTVANINSLRQAGVQVALDDFGTGYTSIAQLMKLPINLLKIDKSLIDNIESNQNIRDLVDSVIYMGHIMNCEVISEGVESEQQINVLKEHKCDFVQGYVWGKPLSFSDAINLC